MMFTVLFFVCGIIEIMGRPNIKSENISDGTNKLTQIPPWPLTKNTFLLPKPLRVDDTINITIVITGSRKFSISLISQNSSSNSTNTICTLVLDIENNEISMENEEWQDDLVHFIQEENETTSINLSFKRRAVSERIMNNHHYDGYGVLLIHNKYYFKPFGFKDLDNLRLLQFTGENFKVSKIGFDFA